MIIPKRTVGLLAAGLGLVLLTTTTLPQAADMTQTHSLMVLNADPYTDKKVRTSPGSQITNNFADGISIDQNIILRPFLGTGLTKVKFGAKRLYDSYVIYISQSF